MKNLLVLFIFTIGLSAKTITPNDVYTLSTLIQDHLHFLLKYYDIEHHHDEIVKRDMILSTKLKPRNTWQKSYEILIKINMLRESHGLARLVPVGIEAVEHLNPDMVYEMNQRILTELKIFEIRKDIKVPDFKAKVFVNKTPLDNYNLFVDISAAFDELNKRALTPNYVYGETMRIYDDISIILNYLDIYDSTVPDAKMQNATPADALDTAMSILQDITQLQKSVGIEHIDFSEFRKTNVLPSDVYTVTGLIISELQPLKAYIGLNDSVTPPALYYERKKPENVEQLMRWNLKRINLIKDIYRRGK